MRGSIAHELEARIERFRQAFAFCRQGQFSFARFLALVPERLRLAIGDDARRIRIPVAITDDLRARFGELLPPGDHDAPGALSRDVAELKRVIRLAQVDPDVDVVQVARWLRTQAEPFTELTRRVYARAFAEVGRGEGGLETAYLVHHLLLGVLRTAVMSSGDRATAQATMLHPLLDLAVEAAAESSARDALPARLGFQLAITTSPRALGADGARLSDRPANAYRTTREAVALARRVVQDPIEVIDLDRVVSILGERQLVDPTLNAGLRRAVLTELVRDGMLLLVAQTWTPAHASALALGREIAGSVRALEQHLFVANRRAQLVAWLRGQASAHRAADAVRRLVEGVDQVLAGDLSPLGVHADLRERAQVAARGALVSILDERTEALRQDVTALLETVPPAESDAAWREGRCYRLTLDEQPLYRTVARAAEGYLVLDLSAFNARILSVRGRGRGLAELTERAIFAPIVAAWQHATAGDPDRVRVARWNAEQVAFRGDVVAVFELAADATARLATAARRLEADLPEILGGGAVRASELAAEITRLSERLATVEGAILRFSDDPASSRFLRDSHQLLAREIDTLSAARLHAEAHARPVEVGAFLALAEPAEELALPKVLSHGVPVAFSRAHAEATLGAAQSPRVARRRLLRGARVSPFRVELVRRPQVPVDLEDELRRALETRDVRAITALGERWAAAPNPESSDEVYNAGCALSGAALEAIRHDRRGVLVFEDRTIAPTALPAALRARFDLGDAPIQLSAALTASGGELVHLFRAAGALRSPLLEREVAVWELLPLDGEWVRALEALGAE